ncbi:hypothetical protein BJY16_002228 [Actinoplanes octamycinicus]|uniref:Uncharacterized protein n=1 Tax=Actinoplanes octamycinicus TaxID=135948 RepID=A0A7W7M6F7_9ACTN|nr:hypothetical protein [Actinoplanes octamycinicus]
MLSEAGAHGVGLRKCDSPPLESDHCDRCPNVTAKHRIGG